MKLSPAMIVLIIGVIVLFGLICGLVTVILMMKKGQDTTTSVLAGSGSALAGMGLGFAMISTISDLA
jgi:Trk-type K+ transport system membrane component